MVAFRMSGLMTFQGSMSQMASTLLSVMGIDPPRNIPPKINLPEKFTSKRIVTIIIDNFGLLECTYYKPRFIIGKSEAIITLESKNPYTPHVLKEIVYGGDSSDFNLFSFLSSLGKRAVMIGRKEDLAVINGKGEQKVSDSDNKSYVETVKVLNRTDFLWVHFLDFEELYKQYSFQPPKETAQKLILRTDSWIKVLYRQVQPDTLITIIGTYGRTEAPITYEGKYATWQRASLPIALIIKK
ncbi:MAG: hypothetical protein QXK32_07945 [Candidatus Jordarchaeales archaeon]